MRITFLHQFYKPDISATAHLVASLAEHRANLGDEVTVIASQGGYVPGSELVRESEKGNPQVIRVWTPRLGKSRLWKRAVDYGVYYLLTALRMLVLRRQDVVFALTIPPAIGWAGVLHRWLHPGTRLVLWNMDCYPELGEVSGKLRPNGLLSRALKAVNRGLFRFLDHLVCLDTAMVGLLHRSYVRQGRELPTTIIPNWEPEETYPDEPPPRWEKARELGLEGRFVVLYLGNMGAGYEFGTALEAADRLRDTPVRFLFVGAGLRYDEVAREAERRGLGNVVLHGYVPKEVTPAVMGCAGCALITLQEACAGMASPSKLHSNLAMRLPVVFVGPRDSNVDEAIRRFGCGVTLRHGDVDGMVNFLRGLMEQPERLRRLQEVARRAFEEAYCDRRTLPQFDRLLDGPASSG